MVSVIQPVCPIFIMKKPVIRLKISQIVILLLCNIEFIALCDRPNILFIMVDDLGKDWVSCYGGDRIQTPNIDALATGGMKFHNAWSMPQCTPSRVSLLTGRYPWKTGWTNHWDVPRWGVGYFDWRRYTTFASVLRNQGYRTAIAGKWQINDFRLEPESLEKHGFNDWCVWTGYEAMNPPSAERYWDPYIHTREGSRTYKGEFGPDIYCDFLIDFMKENRDQPMMLYWPLALTHGPIVPTPEEKDEKTTKGKFAAMVRYTDQLVGRIVKAVDDLGLREKTIIFFTTDNGSPGGVLNAVNGVEPSGGKGTLFEGGVCEPFVVNGPGRIAAGVETDALTDFTDLFPTFVELAGGEPSKEWPTDGRSIAPLLLGRKQDSDRDWILAMGYGPGVLDEEGVRSREGFTDRVVRNKRFKVWVNTNKMIEKLFDLKVDPTESQNLLTSSDEVHLKALRSFQKLVDEMPDKDFRPQYEKRKANPWDRTQTDR